MRAVLRQLKHLVTQIRLMAINIPCKRIYVLSAILTALKSNGVNRFVQVVETVNPTVVRGLMEKEVSPGMAQARLCRQLVG